MKRIIVLSLVFLIIVLNFTSCKIKSDSDLYYREDMNKYITVGEYDLTVDVDSEELEEYKYVFQKQHFSETLVQTLIEGSVQKWDMVEIDYMCKLDGELIDEASEHGCNITVGTDDFILAGFEDKLIGSKIGYSTQIDYSVPEDFVVEQISGKDVVFDVFVVKVDRYNSPDDNSAKKAGFENLSDYEKQRDDFAVSAMLFDRIYDVVEFNSWPEKETTALLDSLLSRYRKECAANGSTLDDLAASYKMSMEEFKDTLIEVIQKNYSNMPRDMVSYWILSKYDEPLTQKDVSATRTVIISEIDTSLAEAGYSDIEVQRRSAYEKALSVLLNSAEVK